MVLTGQPRRFIYVAGLLSLSGAFSVHQANADVSHPNSIIASEDFEQRFQTYRERTAKRPISQLRGYLDSAVEDLFLGPRHVSPTPPSAEVRRFRDLLLRDLQHQLCQGTQRDPSQVEDLKPVVVRSILKAAQALFVDARFRSCGRIAGIVVSIVEQVPGGRLCRSRSFAGLE